MGNDAVARLKETAGALRAALPEGLRSELCLPFDENERRTWFYWPAARRGLQLGALDGEQRQLVADVLRALVTTPTLAKIATIIGLEIVLAELEGSGQLRRRRPDALPRDPSAYATTIFGDPDGPAPWGVRFEGHHVSVHATVVDDELAPTPFFLGANPAVVRHADRIVTRPLAEEEDLARSLLGSLTATQRRQATIDDEAPADILTTNSPSVDQLLTGGVALADLSGEAEALASALVHLHLERTPVTVGVGLGDLHFAWAGEAEVDRPHYYRLSGPRFLVEYDNTQNDANHCHSVWRDPQGDFGTDLLRAHREAHH